MVLSNYVHRDALHHLLEVIRVYIFQPKPTLSHTQRHAYIDTDTHTNLVLSNDSLHIKHKESATILQFDLAKHCIDACIDGALSLSVSHSFQLPKMYPPFLSGALCLIAAQQHVIHLGQKYLDQLMTRQTQSAPPNVFQIRFA